LSRRFETTSSRETHQLKYHAKRASSKPIPSGADGLTSKIKTLPGANIVLLATLFTLVRSLQAAPSDLARQRQQAAQVTIIRDDWGIAHITGKSDADAVFGMIYAQAEDDFNRVELNYLNSMGRLAESEGESKIYQDLRMKLFIDPEQLKAEYEASPTWLQKLMNAWADGLNFYLANHPEVKPKVINRFEPWMALSFTEGSIGGDIERVDLAKLEDFYGKGDHTGAEPPDKNFSDETNLHPPPIDDELDREPTGSNGAAIAPSNTANRHALLLINPHTSFFFRSELQMASAEGLDAYGAVTWGQFFIYQGFNDRAGWMHTSSAVDAVDEYLETVTTPKSPTLPFTYKYGDETRAITQKQIIVPYKTPQGMAQKTFTVYYTTHGPIIRAVNGKWVAIKLMQEPIRALEQSYLRTKARSYKEYWKTMELQANSSNNTIFADADGDIAYFHGNFIPRRDSRFDFTKPVDGSDPATDWHGLLTVEETPHLLNPKSGYLFNVNNWPWAGAGPSSLKQSDYPAYVDTTAETARGLHAMRVFSAGRDFTIDSLIAAAYDSYLPWFDKPLLALIKAYNNLPEESPQKSQLAGQMKALREWDQRWSANSIPTTLAVYWAEDLRAKLPTQAHKGGLVLQEYIADKAAPDLLLNSLASVSTRLTADFGSWQIPWGQVNRFQRINDDIDPSFTDAGPSIPVPFTSSMWGSLASFGAKTYPGTKERYGTSGNSFVAVVEFAGRVHARAVTAGGESGHPNSPHFNDEAQRYATGNLREVYFYPDQLQHHTQATYHPGNL
jgi:acyl-homoserine-lactone acylase